MTSYANYFNRLLQWFPIRTAMSLKCHEYECQTKTLNMNVHLQANETPNTEQKACIFSET